MTPEFEIIEAQPGEAENIALATRAAEVLHAHYPGHLWAVTAEHGMLYVRNLAYRGNWGFVLHADQLDPALRCVMRAGGDLLERHRIARARRTESTYDPRKIGLLRPVMPNA